MSVINSNGSNFGSGQLATVLNQIKAIAEKMKNFNDGIEAQVTVQKQEEGSVNFTGVRIRKKFLNIKQNKDVITSSARRWRNRYVYQQVF